MAKISKALITSLAALSILLGASATFAQTIGSAIVGQVKDQTGGVLPGVAVEVESPALIGGVQTIITGNQGQYRVVDLRPGDYTLTFKLSGFQTLKREGIILRAAFTATVNVELNPAAVEETVTVIGQSPIVDVRTNVSERAIDQELLEEVPTARGIFSVAAMVPGMTTNVPDVGGSETHQLSRLSIHGSENQDVSWNYDGLDVTGNNGSGGINLTYYNQGLQEEISIRSKALPAEIGGGGIYVNMISKDGGNEFKGSMFVSYTNSSLQSDNITDDQRQRGMVAPAGVDSLLDFNPFFGGPIVEDRLWFSGSYRYWRNNRLEANTFNPDGTQALDRQLLFNFSGKLSAQLNPSNRLSFFMDWNRKHREERRNRTSSYQFIAPEATFWQRQGGPVMNVKWSSTVSNNFLLEAGFSWIRILWFLHGQPGVDPLALPRNDLDLSLLEGRTETELFEDIPQNRTFNLTGTWFSDWKGSHNVRMGIQYFDAPYSSSRVSGGLDLTARYRSGVPDSVKVWNTPTVVHNNIQDIGVFLQDSWTIKNRVTINPGVRFERYVASIEEQVAEAGVFIPERHFEKIENVPNWNTIVPRLGLVVDLFGNGKTAFKANVSKYMQRQGASFMNKVNPLRLNSEIRSWDDANGDLFPQLDEIGPDRGGLTRGATVRMDEDLPRPYQWEYTATLEHQVSADVAMTFSYFHRQYYEIDQAVNAALSDADYTPVTIPNPLDGTPFTIYNLNPDSVGRFDNVVKAFDELGPKYNGVEVTFNKRYANNFSLFGGFTRGKHEQCTSMSTNPNDRINACGLHLYDSKYILNLSGLYRLPADLMVSAHFQHKTGQPLKRDYVVTRADVPSLTQVNQRVIVLPMGDVRKDDLNFLDFRLSKRFNLGQRVSLEPILDFFNLLNENAALFEVQTIGPALGRISRNVDGRTVRFAFRLSF